MKLATLPLISLLLATPYVSQHLAAADLPTISDTPMLSPEDIVISTGYLRTYNTRYVQITDLSGNWKITPSDGTYVLSPSGRGLAVAELTYADGSGRIQLLKMEPTARIELQGDFFTVTNRKAHDKMVPEDNQEQRDSAATSQPWACDVTFNTAFVVSYGPQGDTSCWKTSGGGEFPDWLCNDESSGPSCTYFIDTSGGCDHTFTMTCGEDGTVDFKPNQAQIHVTGSGCSSTTSGC